MSPNHNNRARQCETHMLPCFHLFPPWRSSSIPLVWGSIFSAVVLLTRGRYVPAPPFSFVYPPFIGGFFFQQWHYRQGMVFVTHTLPHSHSVTPPSMGGILATPPYSNSRSPPNCWGGIIIFFFLMALLLWCRW